MSVSKFLAIERQRKLLQAMDILPAVKEKLLLDLKAQEVALQDAVLKAEPGAVQAPKTAGGR